MDYTEWEQTVLGAITGDPLWRVEAYRLALFAADLGWHDVTRLMRDRRTLSLPDQLYRALGGIGSCICEGYSRGTGRDRARFYEYSLGSTRESRDWYYKGRPCPRRGRHISSPESPDSDRTTLAGNDS